ncbi:uncharacterized protein LOC120013147 [Tripterygium wilfordii]|uniref:uncharacterized protein LOC120013147 n=1 Tax=Tripterygium wilfordii TaxID=458696 RepID=UPI0018F863D2|nr:uncharacterized protein LOC120013147 [Tripterygium wilfordii]
MSTEEEIKEIEETNTDPNMSGSPSNPSPKARSVRTKVPEVEIHLYRQGKGPIDVFKSSLGGWDQNQLEVRDILEKYGFKSVYAFSPGSGRSVPIRFHSKNGRSILGYKDGSVIHVDGEPKDSLIKPVTKIVVGVAVITLLITLVSKETPAWMEKLNVFGGSFPPWILACMVIVFTRMRKRTRDFLKKYGW